MIFENTRLKPLSVLNILGVSFSGDISWKERFDVLRRLRNFLRHPSCLLFIEVLFTSVWSKSHISGVVEHIQLFSSLLSRAFRLILCVFTLTYFTLTNSLQSLSARRIVALLSQYYRYYNGHCSSDLSCRIPSPLRRACATYPFSVQFSDPRLNRYAQSYMYSIGKVRNTSPLSVFPPSFDLHTFKRHVSGHVGHLRPDF
ncbi:UNVERIFIED_CONTAM: hypothetical protein RMT77_019117 [Armadillidium vulgare]